ncbi:MAG: HlyD family secretion protein [Phenylobacterium sp.]|jgi:HlyD family secretion protein
MKWQINFGSVVVVVLVLACGLGGCSNANQATIVAKADDFHVSVKANGELASSNTAYLSPPSIKGQWRYKLTYLQNEGSSVKKGQMVAMFESNTISDKLKQKKDQLSTVSKELENLILRQEKDQQDLKVQLAQREVNLRKATRKVGQVNETTSQIDSKKLLIDRKIAAQDLTLYQAKVIRLKDKAALTLSIKQREQTTLEAKVKQLNYDLARMSLMAPKDGLFIYGSNHEGEKYAVGDTLHTGSNFAEIPSLDTMIVRAKVSERNLGKIKPGMMVEISLDANPELKYQGKLSKLGSVIREKAKNNPQKVIEAEIEIIDPDRDIMRPGMIARISIVVGSHKDVIVLPSQAITRTNGKTTVTVRSGFSEELREVEVVAFDEQLTALSSGLSAGEEVIL